jgi:hypothetical protein
MKSVINGVTDLLHDVLSIVGVLLALGLIVYSLQIYTGLYAIIDFITMLASFLDWLPSKLYEVLLWVQVNAYLNI